jgi:hypothetical protein
MGCSQRCCRGPWGAEGAREEYVKVLESDGEGPHRRGTCMHAGARADRRTHIRNHGEKHTDTYIDTHTRPCRAHIATQADMSTHMYVQTLANAVCVRADAKSSAPICGRECASAAV